VGTATRRLKHWGWGYEDQQPDRAALEATANAIHERLGFEVEEIAEPVPLEAVELPEPRLKAPAEFGEMFSADPYDRVAHALGKAYRDVVRGFRGEFEHPPDLVAYPESAEDVELALSFADEARAAAIPFGGGTSVVGGVEPRIEGDYKGVISIDLRRMDRVLEVDASSRAARVQAGATGPVLEEQLRGEGLTLRHFPQSFEYSTLGGWIATRAGGHYATLYTHIDDMVESVRALTPAGGSEWDSFRLPGSGAGPSPDRMLMGSEGTLAVIVDAWVRVQERPRWRTSCGVAFDDFQGGAEAVRALAQSGLNPSNCRLLDPTESEVTSAGPPGKALLVLGFESAAVPVDGPMELALEMARGHGGEPGEVRSRGPEDGESERDDPGREARKGAPPSSQPGEDPVGAWRHAFLFAPYLRDSLVACGVLSDTFETAITWDRFPDFHAEVMESARKAVASACGGAAEGPGAPKIGCRFTHVYPDGPAPYYTVLAKARRGSEVEQWDEVKAAVSEVINDLGGTITHHHAVGRDHRPWYERQRPDPFAAALRAAKSELDPRGTLNPGVLIDP
jgi:alkyldihydroxyacetonephosphate synthase